jgi:hypothetical protein
MSPRIPRERCCCRSCAGCTAPHSPGHPPLYGLLPNIATALELRARTALGVLPPQCFPSRASPARRPVLGAHKRLGRRPGPHIPRGSLHSHLQDDRSASAIQSQSIAQLNSPSGEERATEWRTPIRPIAVTLITGFISRTARLVLDAALRLDAYAARCDPTRSPPADGGRLV